MAAEAAGRIRVQGHRGARARLPENTLAGFRYAIALGVDAVELDVLLTKDDVPVVLHDPHINPVLHAGPEAGRAIRSLMLAELREYDCGARQHPNFPEQEVAPGERIPTLDEVLALGRGSDVWFNVEAKSFPDQPELAPEPQAFAESILGALRKHGLERRAVVQSFDARVVRAAGELAPEVARSALWETERDWADVVREFRPTMLSPRHTLVTAQRVEWAHGAGLPVMAWTVNCPEDWARMAAAGVDAMITDDPAGLMAWLAERGSVKSRD